MLCSFFPLSKWPKQNCLKKISTTLCIVVLLFSCKGKKQVDGNATVFTKFPSEINIAFDTVFTFKQGFILGLYLRDSNLILSTANGGRDHFFYEFNLPQKKRLATYVKGGRKAGQALSGYTFGLYQDTLLWMHDVQINKLVSVSLNDTSRKHDFRLSDAYNSIQLMGSSRILAHGLLNRNSPYRMQIVDLKTNAVVSEFAKMEDPPAGIPLDTWINAHVGFVFLNREQDKAVLACRYTDQVEVFDLATKKNTVTMGPENYEPSFDVVKGRSAIGRTPDTRFAFLGGVTGSKYFYLLYSGDKISSENKSVSKYIYVYNWKGMPVKKLNLDRYVSAFAVSNDEKTIYAYDLKKGTVLVSKTNLQ